MLAADEPNGELAEIVRYPFSRGPIQALAIYGDTGGARVDLQARIFDVKLFTGSKIPEPGAKHYTGVVSIRPSARVSEPATAEESASAPNLETPSAPLLAHAWLPFLTLLGGVVCGVFIGRYRRRQAVRTHAKN
jgi:hypothetical protein